MKQSFQTDMPKAELGPEYNKMARVAYAVLRSGQPYETARAALAQG